VIANLAATAMKLDLSPSGGIHDDRIANFFVGFAVVPDCGEALGVSLPRPGAGPLFAVKYSFTVADLFRNLPDMAEFEWPRLLPFLVFSPSREFLMELSQQSHQFSWRMRDRVFRACARHLKRDVELVGKIGFGRQRLWRSGQRQRSEQLLQLRDPLLGNAISFVLRLRRS